jgi:glycosyltransferase involved in cell wall biosynthesis
VVTAAQDNVSVVIATRNRPEMVREAITSVLDQDYEGAVEVLVVFDQSEPDPTIASMGAAPGRSVRVLRNTRKPGLAGARNSGISEASGTYVAFCDDDDYWMPGKLAVQVAALAEVPEASLCTCGIEVHWSGDRFPRSLEATRVPFEELLRDRHTELHPSTFLLRRALLVDDVGLVDEEVPGGYGEDYEFLLRNARVSPIVNVAEPLAVVRWGSQSYFDKRWETMIAGLTWMLERYPEFESSPRGAARIHGQVAFAEASLGNRRTAVRWAASTLRRNPREPRAVLALAVASRAVSSDRVMKMLHARGRGI